MKRTILEAAAAPHSFRELAETVRAQAFWICTAYLALGSVSEVLRHWGWSTGVALQRFLDGMAILAIGLSGYEGAYLDSIGSGALTPFWNRCLLASITAVLIFVQALLLGCAFSAFFLWLEKRLLAAAPPPQANQPADGSGDAPQGRAGIPPQ